MNKLSVAIMVAVTTLAGLWASTQCELQFDPPSAVSYRGMAAR
jgi:hypothetical protein